MDFSFSQEQQGLYDALLRFARRELAEGALERDRAGEFFREGWRKCAEMGVLGLLVPEAYGGLGHDALTCVFALEALGRGAADHGLLFSVGVQILAGTVPLAHFGSETQKESLLRALAEGTKVAAFCATEPGSGSDILSLQTTARPGGAGEVVLAGSKSFVTNAPLADVFLVVARDASSPSQVPMRQLSVYLVERGRPGLATGPPLDKVGLRSSPLGEVFLEDCVVPVENRLGPAGAGYTVFNTVMSWERLALPAIYIGAMEAQLERTTAYTRERRQFGEPIISFQAVAHGLAQMKARLEASRLLVYRAAWLLARRRQVTLEGALAKLVASESYVESCRQAIQLHGAYGLMTEQGVERALRDALAATIYSGTSEVQKNIIARMLP